PPAARKRLFVWSAKPCAVRDVGGRPESTFALRRPRRFDCSRFEHAQRLFFDRIVYAKAAERDATRLAAVEPAAPAGIARDVVIAASIVDGQLLTAAPAADQPGQQGRAALGGAGLLGARQIARYHLPDRLRTRPVDIALMGAWKQGQLFLAWFAPNAAAWH